MWNPRVTGGIPGWLSTSVWGPVVVPLTNSWQIDGETVADLFFWAPKSLQMVTAAMKLKDAYSLQGKL